MTTSLNLAKTLNRTIAASTNVLAASTAHTHVDKSGVTQRETLPDCFDTSQIENFIQQQTREFENVLDRSLAVPSATNNDTRHVQSITMDDTYDVYDRSSHGLIYVDMSEEHAATDRIMQEVDFVTGMRVMPPILSTISERDENQENTPPALPGQPHFLDMFEVRPPSTVDHTFVSTSKKSDESVPSRREPFRETNERTCLSMQPQPVIQPANPDLLNVNKRRATRDSIDSLNREQFLQQQAAAGANQTIAFGEMTMEPGFLPMPELYQESMMDMPPPPPPFPGNYLNSFFSNNI
jgi:hypothetical protein